MLDRKQKQHAGAPRHNIYKLTVLTFNVNMRPF